jgi:hypothetical protein
MGHLIVLGPVARPGVSHTSVHRLLQAGSCGVMRDEND